MTNTLVSVAFVLDCTASMGPWIHAAKTKIHEIVDTVSDQNPDADIEIALVAYRDYGDEHPFRVVDFTSADIIERTLNSLRAEGGDDEAEDVAHALQRTTHLTWEDSELCLVFHIADAPAHGMAFHTPLVSDRFPRGDPDGLDPRDFVEKLSFLDVQYTFVKIHASTDTMIEQFHNCYGNGGTFSVIDLLAQESLLPQAGTSDPERMSDELLRSVTRSITSYTSSQETQYC